MSFCRLWVIVVVICAGCARKETGPPYSPGKSMSSMEVAPGYRVELVVSEADVVSPVAMDIDEDGRIYVVEDRAYPLDVNGRVGRVSFSKTRMVTASRTERLCLRKIW